MDELKALIHEELEKAAADAKDLYKLCREVSKVRHVAKTMDELGVKAATRDKACQEALANVVKTI